MADLPDDPRPAAALWCIGPGQAELRPCATGEADKIGAVQTGTGALAEVLALFSGISRGTERLVFHGRVPLSEADRMRAPHQEGAFSFPVKYGYASVGRVVSGVMAGQVVFALYPHQTRYWLPETALVPLPDGLHPARAVLAANMETALNIVWDSGAGPGDRIAVVGAGVIGALVGYLCARLPGADVTLIDQNPARAALAARLSCGFATPDSGPDSGPQGGCDVVIHASASEAGLALALRLAGPQATVVEASWYGENRINVALGAAFHSQRLRLVSSQVGHLPPDRAPRWTHRRRLAKALELLRDPCLDCLISGETDFTEIANAYGDILMSPATLCHRIRY